MPKYRKKPVVVEAEQFDGTLECAERLASKYRDVWVDWTSGKLRVYTLEGIIFASPGDWIIVGVNGEVYPCKPDVFAKTYEPVTAT